MTSLDKIEGCDIGKEMTSGESQDLCNDTVMVANNTTNDITSNNSDKVYVDYYVIDHDKNKELITNESHEIYDDAGMKEKSTKPVKVNPDTSKIMISNDANEVCRDVSMIDDLTSEETPFTFKEQRMMKNVADDKLLRRHECDKQERNDRFLQKGHYSKNCSFEKCKSTTKKDDSDWGYNVIHVDSCDLQVVGSHDTEELTTRDDFHQDATQIQVVSNKFTAAQEMIPRDIGRDQQKTDKRLTELKFRKILPKVVIPHYKVFNHNIEAQGKQDLMHSSLNLSNREQYAYCDQINGPLNRHERDDDIGRQQKCTHCNKTFKAESDVKEHERTHMRDKKHKCTYCNKAFPRQSHLKRHELIHTGASPHKCKYCGKAFRNNWDVEVHERIHTGVKPYTCNLCNKAFTQRSGLNVHGRVHTGITPYQCNQCNKAFTRKSHLMEHERIHTGVKPYKCTYCNKAFTQNGTLKKHERTHTGVKPYKCKKCGKAFTRRNDLSKHDHMHTGDNI